MTFGAPSFPYCKLLNNLQLIISRQGIRVWALLRPIDFSLRPSNTLLGSADMFLHFMLSTVFPHISAAGLNPESSVCVAIYNRFCPNSFAQTFHPVIFTILRTEDGRGCIRTPLHKLKQEVEFRIWYVGHKPLIQYQERYPAVAFKQLPLIPGNYGGGRMSTNS